MPSSRFQLHLVTEPRRSPDELIRAAALALDGGADWVQLRDKSGSAASLYDEATELLRVAHQHGARLAVNDRLDVALAVGADGVHLAGQSLPVAAAVDLAAGQLLVGRSVHSLAEASAAAKAGVDYVTFGHVFPTTSHPGLPPHGLAELAAIVQAVAVPVLAIGGITVGNLDDVLGTGCAGIAVISAILSDPIQATPLDGCGPRSTLRFINPTTSFQPPHEGKRMQLIVNQQSFEFASDVLDVLTLLASRGMGEDAVAVAVNGEVVPRRRWPALTLADGDRVDLVKVVAGGAWDDDPLVIAGTSFTSRLLMGTGRFVSPSVLRAALEASGTEVVTVAIRMTGADGSGPDAGILSALDRHRYHLLPNTAGATSVRQAVFMAELAREALGTNWVKLEVIGDERTLWPDVAGTVEATRILVREGFVVLPYTTTDLVTALRLEEAGAATVMPLGSMIGSGQGVQDWEGVRRIAERVSVPVVVDAGIGAPSDAVRAMEAGAAACLINTAISRSDDPPLMAAAMRQAVIAGRLGYRAGRMPRLDHAVPSSPTTGLVGVGLSA